MKKVGLLTFFMFLVICSTVFANEAIKIDKDKIFTITFQQNVTLEQAEKYVSLNCTCEVDYVVSYGETEKSIKITPKELLIEGQIYTISVDSQMKSKNGKQIKIGMEQHFQVKGSAVQEEEPVSLVDYKDTLQVKQTSFNTIYVDASFSAEQSKQLMQLVEQQGQYLQTQLPNVKMEDLYIIGEKGLPNTVKSYTYNEQLGGIVVKGTAYNSNSLLTEQLSRYYEKNGENLPKWLQSNLQTLQLAAYKENKSDLKSLNDVQKSLTNVRLNTNPNLESTNAESVAYLALLLKKPETIKTLVQASQTMSFEQAWQKTFNQSWSATANELKTLSAAYVQEQLPAHLKHLTAQAGKRITIYRSASVKKDDAAALIQTFDQSMWSYFEELFPQIKQNNESIKVVILGNEQDEKTYSAAGGYLGSSQAAGWFVPSTNTIVLRGQYATREILAHELFHWVISNGYHAKIARELPLWVEEAMADMISQMYLSDVMDPMQSEDILVAVQQMYDSKNKSDLKKHYSPESVVAVSMIFHEYGIEALNKVLLQAEKSSVEQAFVDLFRVKTDDLFNYTEKSAAYFEGYLKQNGLWEKFERLRGTSAYRAVDPKAWLLELTVLTDYTVIETDGYRIYAASNVPNTIIQQFTQYGNSQLKSYSYKKNRPLLILYTTNQLNIFNKYQISEGISYGWVPGSFALNVSNVNQFSWAEDYIFRIYKDYVK